MKQFGLALVLGFAACLPAEAADPYDVPIRLSSDHHLLVDTWINDEGPYPFIVDSAASGTLVFNNLSDHMALDRVESEGTIMLQASGGPVEAYVVELGRVRIGSESFDMPYTLSFAPGLETTDATYGIVGADVLYRQPVGFALSEGRLHLYHEGEAIDPETDLTGNWFSVPLTERDDFSESQGFYWVEVSLNGISLPALIDTGAQRSTINTAAAVAAGLNPDGAPLSEDQPIRSASPSAVAAWIVPISTLQLGRRVWASRTISLADLPILETFGLHDQPSMILGADFLAEQNFIVDPIGMQLWMEGRRTSALGSIVRTQPTTASGAAAN